MKPPLHPLVQIVLAIVVLAFLAWAYWAYHRLRCKWVTRQNKKLRAELDAMKAEQSWRIIDQLRGDPGFGWSVTIPCDNEEPPPGAAVDCNGEWTDWKDKRFEGDSVLDALKDARTELQAWKLKQKTV